MIEGSQKRGSHAKPPAATGGVPASRPCAWRRGNSCFRAGQAPDPWERNGSRFGYAPTPHNSRRARQPERGPSTSSANIAGSVPNWGRTGGRRTATTATAVPKPEPSANVRTGHVTNHSASDKTDRPTHKCAGSRTQRHVIHSLSSACNDRKKDCRTDNRSSDKVLHERPPMRDGRQQMSALTHLHARMNTRRLRKGSSLKLFHKQSGVGQMPSLPLKKAPRELKWRFTTRSFPGRDSDRD